MPSQDYVITHRTLTIKRNKSVYHRVLLINIFKKNNEIRLSLRGGVVIIGGGGGGDYKIFFGIILGLPCIYYLPANTDISDNFLRHGTNSY